MQIPVVNPPLRHWTEPRVDAVYDFVACKNLEKIKTASYSSTLFIVKPYLLITCQHGRYMLKIKNHNIVFLVIFKFFKLF